MSPSFPPASNAMHRVVVRVQSIISVCCNNMQPFSIAYAESYTMCCHGYPRGKKTTTKQQHTHSSAATLPQCPTTVWLQQCTSRLTCLCDAALQRATLQPNIVYCHGWQGAPTAYTGQPGVWPLPLNVGGW
jgi:hypothetical protein